MFGSLVGLLGDTVRVVAAPVVVAAALTRTVTEPLADAATDVVKMVTPSPSNYPRK